MKTLLLSLAMLFAATSFGDVRAVRHIPWDRKPTCWQMKRHLQKLVTVTNGGAKVVFIGDSITHFWETHGKKQLAKYFSEGDAKMLDLGIAGDRTEHVLWRLNEGKELDGYEAKIIFLMIGTNNTGHFPQAKETPVDTILGITEIVRTIRRKQPTAKLVLTAIFPRGKSAQDPKRKRNEVVNREIRKLADGKTIFWLNFNDQFLDKNGDTKWVMPDRLHPSARGYEIWYAAAKPYVEAALSDGTISFPRSCATVAKPKAPVSTNQVPRAACPASGIGWIGDWWSNRLRRNRYQIAGAKGAFDLVFLGDSITHNWENPGKASLEELRKTYTVLDAGYSGDRTQNLLWRCQNSELDGYKAKCIMVMIGTNNGDDTAQDVAAGIQAILQTIAKKQPQATVLLLPIFPRGASAQDAARVRNEKVNEIIKGYADGEKVVWVDFNAKFLDENGDTKWVMPDRLHPGPDGYKNIWLPTMLPYFQKIVGK